MMLLARRAARIRGAKDSGPKVLHKQLHDESNRSTYFRRLQLLPKPNKTAGRLKAGSPK